MRCPYCQQNIRVQGRFCPKCGEQIFGLPVQRDAPGQGQPSAPTPPGPTPTPTPPRRPAPPPYRPYGPQPGGYDDTIEIEAEPVPAPAAGTPERGPHPAAGDEVGKTCPYCRFPLKPGEQVMTCPACRLPHHADCWNENQGCTTYGCRGVAATPTTPPRVPPTYSPRPSQLPGEFFNPQSAELAGRANTALMLAIIGFFVCCFPLGLVGIFMGISVLADLKRLGAEPEGARAKAIGAIVVGVVSLIVTVIALVMVGGIEGSY